MRPFTSILVDPNTDNRAIFKTAVRAIAEFGEIFMASQLNEVRSMLEGTKPWDIIFTSYRIKSEDITEFLSEFRESPKSAETAVIQIFKMGDASNTKVATTIAQGFNGILCEPFSGDGLKVCAQQSVGLRINGTKDRIKMALSVIIPVVARDAAKNGGKLGQLTREHRELAESCKTLRELAEYAGSTYESMINEVFDEFKTGGSKDGYSGVSKRLKDKFSMEQNVQDQLRQELLSFR